MNVQYYVADTIDHIIAVLILITHIFMCDVMLWGNQNLTDLSLSCFSRFDINIIWPSEFWLSSLNTFY